MTFGKDIKWSYQGHGESRADLFGDSKKPGIYGALLKYKGGTNSKPHFGHNDRYFYVVSGTWWVSSSAHYDPTKMYPVPAGTFVKFPKGAVHFDGAKAETGDVVYMVMAEGPATGVRMVPKDPSKSDKGQDFIEPISGH